MLLELLEEAREVGVELRLRTSAGGTLGWKRQYQTTLDTDWVALLGLYYNRRTILDMALA